ncbi:MAG: hypothetical protein HAW61_01690 [Candidatus Portiera sp.]|nr:hypothetical protein [Portiera sp.]
MKKGDNSRQEKKPAPEQLQYQKRYSAKPTKEEVDNFCEFLDKHFLKLETEIRGEEIGQERFKQSSKKHNRYGSVDKQLSTLFKSGLTLYENSVPDNQDYISPAAHSIREMIYEISWFIEYIGRKRGKDLRLHETSRIEKFYDYFTDLAHHGKDANPELYYYYINELIKSTEAAVTGDSALPPSEFYEGGEYLEIFNEINDAINTSPSKYNKFVPLMSSVYSGDKNIYNYFYNNISHDWIERLEKEGFLSEKINASDPNNLDAGIAEMNFLEYAGIKYAKDVTKVLMKLKKSRNLNRFITSSFLRITINLPKAEFHKVVNKMLKEKWLIDYYVKIYGIFQLPAILEKIRDYESYNDLLKVASSMLILRKPQEEFKTNSWNINEEDFEIDMLDIRNSKLFDYLLERPNKKYRYGVLAMLVDKVNQLIKLYDKNKFKEDTNKPSDFQYFDPLGIDATDISFIDEKIDMPMYTRKYDGMRYLLFVLNKALAEEMKQNPDEAISLHKKYLGDFNGEEVRLINSPATWRLRLHLLSIAPEAFATELKELLFHLFEGKVFGYAVQSEEYFIAVRKCFPLLDESDKAEYIDKLILLYDSYDSEHIKYIQQKARDILGMLKDYIEENHEVQGKLVTKNIIPSYSYAPKPNEVGKVTAGWGKAISPITDEEIAKMSVAEIAQNLRKEWTAEKLDELNTPENNFEFMDVSGVGNLLKTDISKRTNEYFKHAELFFEIDALDPSYTYYYFEGMKKVLESDKFEVSKENIRPVINLCKKMVTAGNGKLLLKENNTMGYSGAIKSMIGFLNLLIASKNPGAKSFMQENRGTVIEIIKLLLTSDDPHPKKETSVESAPFKITGYSGTHISDPLMMAVSSIRGCAYQLFVNFMCIDSDKNIAKDIKVIYEELLVDEKSRAIFFLSGRYLANFYSRDKEWTQTQISKIFPEEKSKKNLYTAAWEGMLSRREGSYIISDPIIQKIYLRGFDLTDKDLPEHQAQLTNPSQQLAEAIAIAYLQVSDFDNKQTLYKKLWEDGDFNTQKYFVNHIGRMVFSGAINDEFSQARFEALWENILQDKNKDSNILKELGNYITLQNNKIEAKWLAKMLRRTLEATEGQLSIYRRMREIIVELAEAAPEDTLEIIKLIIARPPHYENEHYDMIIGTGEEWRDAFISIYTNMMKDEDKRESAKNKLNDVLGELLKHHSLVFAQLVGNLDK